MGVCTNGDVTITFQNEADADRAFDNIKDIQKITEEKYGYTCHFNIQDSYVEDNTFYCNVYSDRVPNGEFQIDEIVKLMRHLVKEKAILPPLEFQGELVTQYGSWYLDEDEFLAE